MKRFTVLELCLYKSPFPSSFVDHLIALADVLKKEGSKMVVVFLERREWVSMFDEKDIPVETIPMRSIFDIYSVLKLKYLIKEHKVDIIHTHFGLETKIIACLLKLLFIPQIKIVWHWRGLPRTELAQPIHLLGKIIISLKKFLGNMLYRIIDYIFVDANIANTNIIQKCLRTRKLVNSEKLALIYNGVDVRKFDSLKVKSARKDLGIGPNEFVVGNVCNFRPEKDHKTIIEAAREVLQKKSNIRFILVGCGPTQEDEENYAEQLGVSDKLIFLGMRKDVERIYASCDLTVFAQSQEVLANVIYESMAMEKPVIVTDVGSISLVMKDGEGVFIVPPSPRKMASKILELMHRPQIVTQAGKMGRETVIKRFTTEAQVKEIMSIYKQLLDRRKVCQAYWE